MNDNLEDIEFEEIGHLVNSDEDLTPRPKVEAKPDADSSASKAEQGAK